MSVTGRLDFTDLESPQAMPPAARAERAHRCGLANVHSELRSQPPQLTHLERRGGLGTPDSFRNLPMPDDDGARTTPTSLTTPMSDEDMVAVLTTRLKDAMELISLQQKILRERKLAAARQAATNQERNDAMQQHHLSGDQHEDDTQRMSGDGRSAGPTHSSVIEQPTSVNAQQIDEHTQAVNKLPKLKEIRCRKFIGTEVYPGLGAGLEDFLNEFERAVRMEQQLNRSTWTSTLKASMLGTFLEGDAGRPYHDFAGDRDITYEELTTHLKESFGCQLSQYELRKKLDATKRAGDTWMQYVRYLQFIERLMEGDQTQLLLETVCNNACPELTSTLLSKVDETNKNYSHDSTVSSSYKG